MAADLYQDIVRELDTDIEDQEEELLSCELLDVAKSLQFWDFLNKISVKDRRTFCRMLDVEDGLGGWENFLQEMGLNRWEDRTYCRKYPGQVGPTERGLELLMEAGTIKNDNLADVLKLFKEMQRYDIISNINWISLIELCNKLEGLEVVNFKPKSQFNNFLPIPSNNEDSLKKDPIKSKITVFIIYAADATDEALFVSKRLRDVWEYGVLIVTEPHVQAELLSDPSNTIHKWFLEVDFIVPILSPQLIGHFQNKERTNEALFNRYIYNLTQHQFVFDFGSKNHRCRPFCPSIFAPQLQKNPVMQGNGLLKLYIDTNEKGIDELATILPMILKR